MVLDYLNNNISPTDRPSKLKPHQILYSVIAVAVIVWAIVYVQQKISEPVVAPIAEQVTLGEALDTATIDEAKSLILNRVSVVDVSPLTSDDKLTLISRLKGSNLQKYSFTVAEQQEIFKAINAQ